MQPKKEVQEISHESLNFKAKTYRINQVAVNIFLDLNRFENNCSLLTAAKTNYNSIYSWKVVGKLVKLLIFPQNI